MMISNKCLKLNLHDKNHIAPNEIQHARKESRKQVSTDFQNDAWFLYLVETVQGIIGNICVEIIFLRMIGAGLA